MIDILNILTATSNCILSNDWNLTRFVIFRQTLDIECVYKRETLSDIKENKVMICKDGLVAIQFFVVLRKFTLPL